MEKLINIARGLLESGKVKTIIGYVEGPTGRIRAAFIRKPEECSKLLINQNCIQNLAVYLLKPEIREFGRPAVIANIATQRSVLQLAQECQIADGEIDVIGFYAGNTIVEFKNFTEIEQRLKEVKLELTSDDAKLIEKINAMDTKQKWQFWVDEFSRCIKCYACRSSCPMCYCSRCLCDCNQPQILSAPSHLLGNLEWHITRAMHLAGRCVACGDCGRACPVGIPLHILTMKIAEDVLKNFGKRAGTTLVKEYALSSFKNDDREDFIK